MLITMFVVIWLVGGLALFGWLGWECWRKRRAIWETAQQIRRVKSLRLHLGVPNILTFIVGLLSLVGGCFCIWGSFTIFLGTVSIWLKVLAVVVFLVAVFCVFPYSILVLSLFVEVPNSKAKRKRQGS